VRHYVLIDNKIVGIRQGLPKYAFRHLSTGQTESYVIIKPKRMLIRRE
jgi:hypothetical protein